jgi:hypothetical protein
LKTGHWKDVASFIGTKNAKQVQSHAVCELFFMKITIVAKVHNEAGAIVQDETNDS